MKKSLSVWLCILLSASLFAQQIPVTRTKNLSDTALLELLQKQTFKYFWDFGHPVSGMARERSNVAFNYGHEVVTTGGTGFGVMAMVVGASRLRSGKIVEDG